MVFFIEIIAITLIIIITVVYTMIFLFELNLHFLESKSSY